MILVGIVEGLTRLGVAARDLPTFFPIDGFNDEHVQAELRSLHSSRPAEVTNEDIRDHMGRSADLMRYREGLVLHQAQSEAAALAQDGQDHRMAIVQGAQHGTTAEALQAFGARVQRVQIHQPGLNKLEDIARTGGRKALTDAVIDHEKVIYSLTDYIATATGRSQPQEVSAFDQAIREYQHGDVIATLVRRGLENQLPEGYQTTFDRLLPNINTTPVTPEIARTLAQLALELDSQEPK